MSSASFALQQAMYAALAGSAALKALIGDPPRLFDAVPRGFAFPYVVIGEDNEAAWNTADTSGSEHRLSIHAWSRAGGRKEAKLIADAIRAGLDDAALTLDGHHLVSLNFLSAAFGRDADGKTFRGRIDFRAVTEPK
jgi:hypothetical protein